MAAESTIKIKRHRGTITKTCVVCGSEFETKSGKAKYCSEKCCKQARKENRYADKSKPIKKCRICGKEFTHGPSYQHICSEECRKIYKQEKNKNYRENYNDLVINPNRPITDITYLLVEWYTNDDQYTIEQIAHELKRSPEIIREIHDALVRQGRIRI